MPTPEELRTEIAQLTSNFDFLVKYFQKEIHLKTLERDKLRNKLRNR
jgi:hypothetical protein